jgi:hypothetical protein
MQKLIDRMLSFDERAHFDGYPSTTEHDITMIIEASKEAETDPVMYLCFLASEHVTTSTQYENAQRYLRAYLSNVWECNMTEGSNPVHSSLL